MNYMEMRRLEPIFAFEYCTFKSFPENNGTRSSFEA